MVKLMKRKLVSSFLFPFPFSLFHLFKNFFLHFFFHFPSIYSNGVFPFNFLITDKGNSNGVSNGVWHTNGTMDLQWCAKFGTWGPVVCVVKNESF